MTRPVPTPIMHFTHVAHLSAIAQDGLLADTAAQGADSFQVEVGNRSIKDSRRRREVPLPPGGVVADFAPFYFAPRSPMMYAIEHGGVSTYKDGCDELVYLVSTVERLTELQLPALFTDRNAVLRIATYTASPGELDELIDWPLMNATYWHNTDLHPDRRERRMAECLVHERVPWQAIDHVVTRNEACALRAERALAAVEAETSVVVRPRWYF